LNAIIQFEVNELDRSGTVNATTFSISDTTTGNNPIRGTYSVSADGLTVTFVPSAPLITGHQYSANSLSGGMTDLAGNGITGAIGGIYGTPARKKCE